MQWAIDGVELKILWSRPLRVSNGPAIIYLYINHWKAAKISSHFDIFGIMYSTFFPVIYVCAFFFREIPRYLTNFAPTQQIIT